MYTKGVVPTYGYSEPVIAAAVPKDGNLLVFYIPVGCLFAVIEKQLLVPCLPAIPIGISTNPLIRGESRWKHWNLCSIMNENAIIRYCCYSDLINRSERKLGVFAGNGSCQAKDV